MEYNYQRHLDAAKGWLDLGDWHSANYELDEIPAAKQSHLDVLKLRVVAYCKARQFNMAAIVSDAIAKKGIKDAQFWFNRGIALCKVGRTHKAKGALIKAFNLQPDLRRAALNDPDLEAVSKQESRLRTPTRRPIRRSRLRF